MFRTISKTLEDVEQLKKYLSYISKFHNPYFIYFVLFVYFVYSGDAPVCFINMCYVYEYKGPG